MITHALVELKLGAAVLTSLRAFLFFAAFALLLLQPLVLTEGAERACPKIGNFTINVIPVGPLFAQEEIIVVLLTVFYKPQRFPCECTLHEIIRGRSRLKVKANRCEYLGADQ